MIGVIVPFTRPSFLEEVVVNFGAQTYGRKKLVVVENAGGIGAWKATTHKPDVLISAVLSGGKADALNLGISAARKNGCDHFAVFDDDDWYGPNYLSEVARCAGKADATGIHSFIYRSPDGDLWTVPQGQRDCHVTETMMGGTLAGSTNGLPEFKPLPFSEDMAWCRDILHSGKTLYARSNGDYQYRRFATNHRHTFPFHMNTANMTHVA